MTKLHRKDLKQDEVRQKLVEAIKGVSFHGKEALYLLTIVIAIGFIAIAWSYYEKNQQQESQNLLGVAIAKFRSPVGEQPPNPQNPEAKPEYQFKTESEKYTSALKDFEQIIQKYGNTPAAAVARYNAGVAAFYLGDYKKSEDYLKQAARVSDRNVLYYLVRMALANLYSATGKTDDAIRTLNEAISSNKEYVPSSDLLLQLAGIYKNAGKSKEAQETYQKIVNDYKDSPASFQAQNELDELKNK